MKKLLVVLLTGILIFSPGQITLAADYESEVVSAKEYFELFQEDQVVQIATKTPIKLKYAPSTVSVVTAEDIKRNGYKNLKQILEHLPGVDSRYSRQQIGATHIAFRGIGGRGGGSWRILWLIDGRIANRAFEEVFEVNDLFPINHIQRIEVLRGPGSAMYGENAFTGVVNIITKDAKDIEGLHVNTFFGDNETYGSEIEFGRAFGEEAGFAVTGRWYGTDEMWDGAAPSVPQDNDPAKSGHITTKLNMGKTELSVGHLNAKTETPDRTTNVRIDRFVSMRETYANLDTELKIADSTKLKGKLFGADGDHFENSNQGRIYDETTLGAEVQMDHELLQNNTLVAGASLHRYEADFPEHVAPTDPVKKAHVTFSALFLQDEFRIKDNLILTGGARFDDHSLFNTVISPRGSIVWGPTDSTVVKGLYGEAFRAPELRKVFGQGPGNVRESLDPERVQTTELVITQKIGTKARVGLNAFYNEFRKLIERPSGVGFYSNLNKGIVQGAELEIELIPTDRIKTFANWSVQETHEADPIKVVDGTSENFGKELDYAPKNKFNWGVDIDLIKRILSLSLVGRYVGSRLRNATDHAGAFYTQDVTLRATLKNLEVSGSVYNVFDRDYQETVGRPTPLRTWLARVGYKFGNTN